MYQFPSEDGDEGPFVSKDNLWLQNKFCPKKINCCMRLLSKLLLLESENFEGNSNMFFLILCMKSLQNVECY